MFLSYDFFVFFPHSGENVVIISSLAADAEARRWTRCVRDYYATVSSSKSMTDRRSACTFVIEPALWVHARARVHPLSRVYVYLWPSPRVPLRLDFCIDSPVSGGYLDSITVNVIRSIVRLGTCSIDGKPCRGVSRRSTLSNYNKNNSNIVPRGAYTAMYTASVDRYRRFSSARGSGRACRLASPPPPPLSLPLTFSTSHQKTLDVKEIDRHRCRIFANGSIE